MIIWLKRFAAFMSGILLFLLLYPKFSEFAVLGGAVNLVWVLDNKLPLSCRRFFHPGLMVFNAVCSAFAVFKGGSAWLAMALSGSALTAWNIGLFQQSSPEASALLQRRYAGQLGFIIFLGLVIGCSALALQGCFSASFPLIFFLMLVSGFLFWRLLSKATKIRPNQPIQNEDIKSGPLY